MSFAYATTASLPAATATPIDIPINGATNWTIVVTNTGANPVTVGTFTRYAYPLPGGEPGPATALPAGIPLAAAASLTLQGANEPLSILRLTFTSLAGTTVSIQSSGT